MAKQVDKKTAPLKSKMAQVLPVGFFSRSQACMLLSREYAIYRLVCSNTLLDLLCLLMTQIDKGLPILSHPCKNVLSASSSG